MTPTHKQRAELAALKAADKFYPDSKIWDSRNGNYYSGFLAGYAAALASEEVKGLWEALNEIVECTGTSTRQNKLAREALAKFADEEGV